MQSAPSNVSQNGKDLDSAADTVKSNLSQEFHRFIADVEDLVKATTGLKGDELHQAKQKMQQRIVSAKESMEQAGESISTRTRKAAETTNHYVHERPWNAIGASAAIGLLMGFLLARRH
ncbi:DUF883 family protein [Flavobacterium sp. W21_SRS_FM6]|uniref:DUF883 family protein n=1 Tax=Flavobacterium sp. W21_SRS_FM6 TaxID=3240268 RepID=UPI003F91289F